MIHNGMYNSKFTVSCCDFLSDSLHRIFLYEYCAFQLVVGFSQLLLQLSFFILNFHYSLFTCSMYFPSYGEQVWYSDTHDWSISSFFSVPTGKFETSLINLTMFSFFHILFQFIIHWILYPFIPCCMFCITGSH